MKEILGRVGPELLAEATATRLGRTVAVSSLEEAIEAGSAGFATIPVRALGPDGEDRLATKALCRSGASSAPTAAWPKPATMKRI